MRVLWTLVKVVVVLALVIPVGIIAMALALGIFGALLGLAMLALRVAIVGLVAYGAFKLIARLVRGPAPRPQPVAPAALPPVDPYYQAAMRELDRDIGYTPR
jgi:hypothetical protein